MKDLKKKIFSLLLKYFHIFKYFPRNILTNRRGRTVCYYAFFDPLENSRIENEI